ncbi:MAG: M6 family metalloprotease domain-containing protein [Candidatus Zipacnadales bacterium]
MHTAIFRLTGSFFHLHGERFAVLVSMLCITVLSVCQTPTVAGPAWPHPITLRQPDGTTFRAFIRGDEWQHWIQTDDGRIVERNAQGQWVTVGYGRPPLNPRRVADHIAATTRKPAVSPFGTGYIPVLCINYSDTNTTYTTGDFQSLLFGASGSVSAFYAENSYGQYTVDSGPEGIGGWYDASQTHDYYGANTAGSDSHAAELVIEAVKAADAAGFDFAPYDQDGDGYVDVVAVIHQGTGEDSSGDPDDIWPHRWDLNSAAAAGDGTGEVTTSSGVKVNDYIIQSEQLPGGAIRTIGVFCHEYGHGLGLPDFYDYTYQSQGLGQWSLMAFGSWGGGDGSSPAHFDAWCKARLGWVMPTVATTTIMNAQVPQVETNPVIFQVAASMTEYYLIENRQQVGFDAALPGSGILIYHVDDTQTDNNHPWYPGHTTSGHYWVALEQADGLWELEKPKWDPVDPGDEGDGGDPYPGTTSNKAYDDTSTPDATCYDGTRFPLVVRNISQSSAIMTLDIMDINAPAAPRTITAIDTPGDDGGSVTVTWALSTDDGKGANDVVAYEVHRATAASGPFTFITSLPAGTTTYLDTDVIDYISYWYKVIVKDATGLSAESAVAGPAIPRDDSSPDPITNLVVRDTQADNGRSITLSWVGYVGPADLTSFRVYRSREAFTSVLDEGVKLVEELTNPAARSYIDRADDPDADPTDPTKDVEPFDQTDYYYAVTAVDDVGNVVEAVESTGPVQCAPNLSLSYNRGLCMITVPALPIDPAPADVFGFQEGENVDFGRYDPLTAAYRTYSLNPDDPFISIVPGHAYWLKRDIPTLITVGGHTVEDPERAVPLEQGWNQVGSPYNADYVFANIDVCDALGTREDITASHLVRNYGWRYDAFAHSYRLLSPVLPNAEPTLPAREGMWIYAMTAGLSLIFENNVAAADSQPTAAEPTALDGWQMRLVARAADATDTDNWVGVCSTADAIGTIISPPPVAGGVDLYFPVGKGERGAINLHKTTPATTRAIVESGTADVEVQLSWPDLSQVPNSVRPILKDLSTGRSVYMRTATSYTYRASRAGEKREFEISFPSATVGLVLTQVAAVPTKTGGAEFTYTLTRPATVRCQVLNLAGRVVASVATPAGEVGLNRGVWNGCADTGRPVPNGRYLIRLTAVADDNGETANAVTTVSIKR